MEGVPARGRGWSWRSFEVPSTQTTLGFYGFHALTVRFITRRFIGDYDPTLEMIYRHVAVIDGEMVHFEILDTAGQVKFLCLQHQSQCVFS
uniref:small monomeric GTPase n=1 Tax=Amazona collaria TaxID=241587 RepID=A0A8B9G5Z7_9PSIT